MQGDFIRRNDDRLYSGYGSALLVREFGDRFFNLLIPTEMVPGVAGEYATYEYDSLLADAISKVKGKRSLDSVSTDFTYSRENMLRLDKFVGKTWEFMRFNPNFTYETFTAEIDYRQNDAEPEVLKGELNIVPSLLGVKGIDGRDLIRQSLEFSNTLPDTVSLTNTENSKTVDLGVKQADANATYEAIVEGSDKIKATVTGGKLTISVDSTATNDAYGVVIITAKSETKMTTEGNTDALKYAPWTMTIAVDYKA